MEKLKERLKKSFVWEVSAVVTSHFIKHLSRKLIEPILSTCCPEGGLVLDPFMGTGTTAIVALKQGKYYTGIDLMQSHRICQYSNTKLLKTITIFSDNTENNA